MIKKIILFFDKLEDRTRAKLSRKPILYAFLGGIGIVLFWRGVWHLADDINLSPTSSIFIGSVILLVTGIFVSAFVGNRIILSGLLGNKKFTEKAEDEIAAEVAAEGAQIKEIKNILNKVETRVSHLDDDIHKK